MKSRRCGVNSNLYALWFQSHSVVFYHFVLHLNTLLSAHIESDRNEVIKNLRIFSATCPGLSSRWNVNGVIWIRQIPRTMQPKRQSSTGRKWVSATTAHDRNSTVRRMWKEKTTTRRTKQENNCMNLIARLVSTIGWNDDMTRWHSTEHNRVEKERDIKTDATAKREQQKNSGSNEWMKIFG